MSLNVYKALKKSMFIETIRFMSTKYELFEDPDDESTSQDTIEAQIKALWEDYKKYETKAKTKGSKTKKPLEDSDRCTRIKANGDRCTTRKCSSKVLEAHPEYDQDLCALHNRVDNTPKKASKGTKSPKKFICGHETKGGKECQTKVSEEGEKCKVYQNMMAKRAAKAKDKDTSDSDSEEETPIKTPKTPNASKATPKATPKATKDNDNDSEDNDSEEETPKATPKSPKASPKSPKASPKRVILESDDEEEE
jgi:hypothetical protein